jgi:hypothetical protein
MARLGKRIDTGLKPGDLCYRVVLYVPPEGPDVWRVESATVQTASDRMITFCGYRFGMSRQRFPPESLGWLFFRTSDEALAAFVKRQTDEIAALERRIEEARTARTWATVELAELRKDRGDAQ